MGCYETVMLNCPSCGREQPAQSKSGPCEMGFYPSSLGVPKEVMQDINRHAPFNCGCGTVFEFNLERMITVKCEYRPPVDYLGVEEMVKKLKAQID